MSLKISLIVFCLLTIRISYAQNPDGNLVLNVKDKSKDIKFELLKYTHNQNSIIYDKSEKYSIKIKGFKSDKKSSLINLRIIDIEGISCFDIELGWTFQISVEITKKIRNKIEVMTVIFDHVYAFSPKTEIRFKKGMYYINVKEFFKSEGITTNSSDKNIDQKYYKKIEQ